MAAFRKFIHELRRRRVLRSGIAYAVGCWLLLQGADMLLPVFDGPDWIVQVLLGVFAAGFPVALVFAWFYAITPEGIKRTQELELDDSAKPIMDRRVDLIVIGLLVAALGLSLYGNLRSPDEPPQIVSILIADFENRTDEELYSGVLEDFLVVGLEVAPFVDNYSRKTAKALAATLPGSDSEAPVLDPETASLLALREGINIVIAGSVARTRDGLTININAMSAGDQKELFEVTEVVDADADVLAAIAAVAKDLRIELGNAEKPGIAGDSESFAVTNLEAAAEYLKAQDLQLDRRLEEAVVHYKKALQLDPEFARAYAGLALTEQYLGNADAATGNWKEALARLDRLTERGRLRTLGNYYMINQGNYDKALETYETLVSKYPADNVAQNNLAVTAFYALDFDRAMEVGREVAVRYPKHSGYRANYALYAMYASQFAEGLDVATALIDDDPTSAYAYLVLALSAAASGRLDDAEDAFRRMTELDQFGRSIGKEGLADLAMYRGDLDSALAILDAAIAEEQVLNATHTVALKQVMRAEALLRAGRNDRADEAIRTALQNAGGDPAILVPAARILIELGDMDAAGEVAAGLSASLSIPKQAYGKAVLAQVAAANEDWDNAVVHADAGLEIADLWLLRFVRAETLVRAGRRGEAQADLERCRERAGEGIAVFLNDRPSFRMLLDLDAVANAG